MAPTLKIWPCQGQRGFGLTAADTAPAYANGVWPFLRLAVVAIGSPQNFFQWANVDILLKQVC